MCNAASDGDRYSGRTEPAEVSGGHGRWGGGSLIFVCVSLWDVTTKQNPSYLPTMNNIDLTQDIGHNHAVNGPMYTIWGYKWIAKKV
jgi:hypothetical protein